MYLWLMILFGVELSTAIIAALHYKKLKEKKLESFPAFLFFVFFGELFAFFLAYKYRTNILFHNIFATVQIVYYLLLIRHQVSSKAAKKVLLLMALGYILLSVLNALYVQSISKELMCYAFTVGCLLISVSLVYFFYELILSNDIADYPKKPFFWIGLGLFIFYICNIPFMSIYNYLSNNYPVIFVAYFSIIEFLNYIMYTFFIIGILCTNRKRLPLQSS